MKKLKDLTEAEILALAISNEEEDSRIYADFAHKTRESFPATAAMFDEMTEEEQLHKNMLISLYRLRFGEKIPYITRADVKGFMKRRSLWLMDNVRIDVIRRQAELMEMEAVAFYTKAAEQVTDIDVRKLLGDLAIIEQGHAAKAENLQVSELGGNVIAEEDREARRLFLLQIVQPALTGLVDGSISTLAPIFAAAFATHNSWDAFVVGMAASIGAGISMGITESVSDDGALTQRGSPLIRGVLCGLATTVGGLGHTLPYLITDFWTATIVAFVVVVIELFAIAWIRWKYMELPFGNALVQVVLGGILVLLTGILIGGA